MNDPSKVESILLAALEQATAEARSAYLDDVCQDNPGLRAQVNRLLAAHPKAVEFLEMPAAAVEEKTAVYVPTVEKPGSILVGRYKLLEMIGEGGMGEVWVADQLEPIKRRVALKLIKPGMDSRSVLGRFEAERQALAVMDHPNIAKVLDAGTTADGRPYFVMELVKGTPITVFCDARKLTPNQRLELFIPVCQAIQHAHMKGIIHRDIKPSNVLVALHDETPVPKVIDFGVAKAVGQQLTEKTIYTGFGALVGTPAYMAPEQATFNQLDIDTRADVYALGVLLYELLVGSPPIEKERLKQAALDEVLRIVRDEEPPRPSQRLSTSQTKASIAATRQSDPAKLSALMKGEIDWIVMKALEKDRTRRYDTANGLAKDIQCYLAGDAVEACPPTLGYRVQKAYRKNRAAVRVGTAFAMLLIAAVAVSSWLAVQAKRAESVSEDKRVEAEANAKEAKEQSDGRAYALGLLSASEEQLRLELTKANVTNASLQFDLDLTEIKTDSRIGLLRLTRTKQILSNIKTPLVLGRADEQLVTRHRALREFVAAAILSNGQSFAPLLPPITHDGIPVLHYHCQIDPNHRTLLTEGKEGTARLWDLWTARPLAILQRKNEKVVHCGYTSDGLTIFTDDGTGLFRFWSATNGKYRAQTETRPNLYAEPENEAINKMIRETQLDWWGVKRISRNDCVVIGKDRLLTRHVVVKQRPDTGDEKVFDQFFSGPVELWDTAAGRLVAQLEVPDTAIDRLQFLGAGRWITTMESPSTVMVFSAVDGRLVSRLVHPAGRLLNEVYASPSSKRIVTLSHDTERVNSELAFWDTDSWKMVAAATPVRNPSFRFLKDDASVFLFSDLTDHYTFDWDAYYMRNATTEADFDSGRVCRFVDNLALLDGGKIIDTVTGKRLLVPANHRFHSSLAKFAPDGRLVVGSGGLIIDTLTEKQFEVEIMNSPIHISGLGYVWVDSQAASFDTFIRRFPSVEQLDIPARHLELWVQVAVRGELGTDGEFVKWDEQEWEKKRQELAALPVPYPSFPFPGYVATDRFHWLRSEYYVSKNDAERQRLTQELLRRAVANGDQSEALRWRATLAAVPGADPASRPSSK